MQGHQRTFNKDEEDGGAVANSYTTLTLHPSVQLPPSPESVLVSSIFSAEIDPKWEFNRENIQLTEVLNEGQFTVLYKGIAKGIREKPIEVAVKSVKGEGEGELGGVSLIGIHGFYELHVGSCCVIAILIFSSPSHPQRML